MNIVGFKFLIIALCISAVTLLNLAHAADNLQVSEKQILYSQLLDEMAIATDELNASLPQMVDEGLRLERTNIEGQNFVYYYTLIEQIADETDRNQFASVMNTVIHDAVCVSKDMSYIIDVGIPIVYSYSGKFGNNISSFIIDKSSCARYLAN